MNERRHPTTGGQRRPDQTRDKSVNNPQPEREDEPEWLKNTPPIWHSVLVSVLTYALINCIGYVASYMFPVLKHIRFPLSGWWAD